MAVNVGETWGDRRNAYSKPATDDRIGSQIVLHNCLISACFARQQMFRRVALESVAGVLAWILVTG